ncbi:MAG: hypothetical protein ACYCQL_00170 [Acidithiobacillus sp.]
MSRSPLSPVQPATAIIQQSAAAIVRPATSEQALEMLCLMMTDVIAQAEATMAGWAERMPLDDQDAPQAKARETAAKDRNIYQKYLGVKRQRQIKKPNERYLTLREWYEIWTASGH